MSADSTFALALDDASLERHWDRAMTYLEQQGHDTEAMMRNAVSVVNAWKDNPAQRHAIGAMCRERAIVRFR